MNIRVIGIGGVPASGKTTHVVNLMNKISDLKKVKMGKLKGYYSHSHRLYILGLYNGSLFQGTDKLSMTAVTDLYKLCRVKDNVTIMFEGDRFFSRKVFETLEEEGSECVKIIFTTQKQAQRIKGRGSEQTEQFLKAKNTKIANLMNLDNLTVLSNDTGSEMESNAKHLWSLI